MAQSIRKFIQIPLHSRYIPSHYHDAKRPQGEHWPLFAKSNIEGLEINTWIYNGQSLTTDKNKNVKFNKCDWKNVMKKKSLFFLSFSYDIWDTREMQSEMANLTILFDIYVIYF